MFSSLKGTIKQDIRKIRRKYRILKIKWFLLFVLPILLIFIAYQTAKQFLKLKLKSLGTSAAPENETIPETTPAPEIRQEVYYESDNCVRK